MAGDGENIAYLIRDYLTTLLRFALWVIVVPLWLLAALLSYAIVGVVAVHFISKFW